MMHQAQRREHGRSGFHAPYPGRAPALDPKIGERRRPENSGPKRDLCFWTSFARLVRLAGSAAPNAASANATDPKDIDMSEQNVQQDTFEIIAKQAKIDIATIKPESTLKELGVASLDAIEVIFDLEEHFDIQLPNEDADFDNGTVGQLVAAIERQLAAK